MQASPHQPNVFPFKREGAPCSMAGAKQVTFDEQLADVAPFTHCTTRTHICNEHMQTGHPDHVTEKLLTMSQDVSAALLRYTIGHTYLEEMRVGSGDI